MAKRRRSGAPELIDFIAEVEFVGVPSPDLTRDERKNIVQEILKQWTERAHRRGRPSNRERDLKDAA